MVLKCCKDDDPVQTRLLVGSCLQLAFLLVATSFSASFRLSYATCFLLHAASRKIGKSYIIGLSKVGSWASQFPKNLETKSLVPPRPQAGGASFFPESIAKGSSGKSFEH